MDEQLPLEIGEVQADDEELPELDIDSTPASKIATGAFGGDNRTRLLDLYFDQGGGARGSLDAANAWEHIYRLLLWIDRTTNLAHCYESDKCQPGNPWYARSAGFHVWLAEELDVPPVEVRDHIDVLFRQVTHDLAIATAAKVERLEAAAAAQLQRYESVVLPEPGRDPQLESIVTESLSRYLAEVPSEDVYRDLIARITAHVGQENKRKNLVGEGFEDTLAAILNRLPAISAKFEIMVRPPLDEIEGFNPPRGREKRRAVDLVLIEKRTRYRTLISCKWSVRSDREGQFPIDYQAYTELEALGQDFDYVLVTNEFDPARLAAACDMRSLNRALFSNVVHVNVAGPVAAYSSSTRKAGPRSGTARTLAHAESRRLESLEDWLQMLASGS